MKQFKFAASAVLCLIIGGCASGQSIRDSKEAANPIPSGKGRIVVYRDGLLDPAIQPTISVDGQQKGKCKPKGAFFADVTPGDHTISAKTEVKRQTLVHVEEGKSSYVRCNIGLGVFIGQPRLEVIPPHQGKVAVDKLVFTGRY